MQIRLNVLVLTVLFAVAGSCVAADQKHDWNLGATGLRGWIRCDKLVTSDAREIRITKVEKGSPAEGVLQVGDVILGVGSKPFSHDPRTEMGQALTLAESEAGQGHLTLTRSRNGRTDEVVVQLPILGTYSATAPYNCPKSKLILEQGCSELARRMATPDYAQHLDPIPRSLNALALLASGDPSFLPLIQKEAQWAASYRNEGMATWYYGYVTMFLAEYKIATGDDSVMPDLKRLALEAAQGQSAVGSWGHGFAKPDGRLGGYGMMNSPGLPLTISLVLAREAGVKDPALDLAIERSMKLLRFYVGKGAIPYGDHHPWIETHEDNGKCGMAAVLFNILGESKGAEFFSHMSLASHGPERDCGHTGNFFNILWAMPGVAQAGPNATGAWMKEYGNWYFDLARRWDHSYLHQGPPEPGSDSYADWDSTGSYLLAYAMPLKKIYLTGKKPGTVTELDATAAQSLIVDGRGWDNKDRKSFYDSLSDEQLIERLESWSPVVRERAAMAMGRRKNPPVTRLIEMLDSPSLDTRYGACQALIFLRKRGAPAVDTLQKTLQHPDLWLRIKAAEALAAIGAPATKAVPQLLELLAQVDRINDPRGMQQRYLSFALFDDDGMLGRSLDGVDRPALYKAVRAGLKNEDGRARGSIGSVYRHLSLEEIKPLLPAIYEAIIQPAPSGEMFADGIRVEGLRLLSQHHIEEGMHALVTYTRDQNPWASEQRTPELMEILLTYGSHAKAVIPELTQIANYFEKDEKDFPRHLMRMKAKCVRETITAIKASQASPQLVRIAANSEAKPLKVFILAGQSNMEGHGVVSMDGKRDYNGGKGNLVWSMKHSQSAEKLKRLKNEKGEWVIRDDVQISFKVDDKVRKGGLTIGYTGYGGSSHIGPELGFGFVMGDYLDEPVLLIKTAWGGKSLFVDFRPPSSGGQVGPYYTKMVEEVRAALAELGDQKYEIAGFVWQQGWNDMCEKPAIAEYAQNLVNLVKDLRKEFDSPNLPVVVGELGNGGPVTSGDMFEFRKAQEQGTGQINNALFIKTTDFARPAELSPNTTHGHHWFGNAESYFLIGEALGEGMKQLLKESAPNR
ncbi:protein of unknown function DUF303 acetylesterase putative [Planctopirus limnophila DSM 3776]|uniref:PDZ domain-containing protein n=1 Tax=Planctopirus limnophila (strain ATCC 43296 / DSM 3776 / IFAM 1008 / Mu 290) TaxID=521674 RepID=D5STD7_PLAL2|nr:DUF6288 domain-containing protein [Planctopirus limnophila]ADG68966.1 protein of unknown function DUF303 acetylesterase putative [Planctopirus limnophila DSM 3776]